MDHQKAAQDNLDNAEKQSDTTYELQLASTYAQQAIAHALIDIAESLREIREHKGRKPPEERR